MILTDRDDIRVGETDEEFLTFAVSDDALERAAAIVGEHHCTRVFGTAVDCGPSFWRCPVPTHTPTNHVDCCACPA